MKKSFLIFLMIISSITMLAQTKKYYCEVKGIEKELSSGLKLFLILETIPCILHGVDLKVNNNWLMKKEKKSHLTVWLMQVITCLTKVGLSFRHIPQFMVLRLSFIGYSIRKQQTQMKQSRG